VSLLGRLGEHPANQHAWHDFVQIYGYHLLEWTRRFGLQDADAQDVTQLILLRLSKVMRHFEYDPSQSFRAWLRTVTQRIWQDFIRSRKNNERPGDPLLFSLQAEREFTSSIETAYHEELLMQSIDNVRLRVQPQTWEAFRLTTFEQKPSQAVATELGISLATVYKAKSNILKLLQEEVLQLEESLR
jgi:RNA polymerase sigma factor (sigma-70 family)